MTKTISYVWNMLGDALDLLKEDDLNNCLVIKKKDRKIFQDIFLHLYDCIMQKYMSDGVDFLDRHKVAAIIIITILRTVEIEYTDLPEEQILWGKQTVALNIGLSYMCDEMNTVLKKNGCTKLIDHYFMPEASSCETSYQDIMIRNLVYAENNPEWGLNPLDIAEKLYLLEYITLMKEQIPLSYLDTKEKNAN